MVAILVSNEIRSFSLLKLFLNVKRKKSIYEKKTVNRVCVKECPNIFYWIKKRLVWFVLE